MKVNLRVLRGSSRPSKVSLDLPADTSIREAKQRIRKKAHIPDGVDIMLVASKKFPVCAPEESRLFDYVPPGSVIWIDSHKVTPEKAAAGAVEQRTSNTTPHPAGTARPHAKSKGSVKSRKGRGSGSSKAVGSNKRVAATTRATAQPGTASSLLAPPGTAEATHIANAPPCAQADAGARVQSSPSVRTTVHLLKLLQRRGVEVPKMRVHALELLNEELATAGFTLCYQPSAMFLQAGALPMLAFRHQVAETQPVSLRIMLYREDEDTLLLKASTQAPGANGPQDSRRTALVRTTPFVISGGPNEVEAAACQLRCEVVEPCLNKVFVAASLEQTLGFVGLPNDILKSVLELLDVQTLRAVANVCKQLHAVAEPILERHGKRQLDDLHRMICKFYQEDLEILEQGGF